MSQMHSYGCQHQAPASPGHTCSRLFKVLLESPVPCSCSGGGGHELGGVRILGNAGVGAAGKEPLDNELGQVKRLKKKKPTLPPWERSCQLCCWSRQPHGH